MYYLTEYGKGLFRSRHGRPMAPDVESTTPKQRGKLISKPAVPLPEIDRDWETNLFHILLSSISFL